MTLRDDEAEVLNRFVELMVVANSIPSERRLTCESRDIECREIVRKLFETLQPRLDIAFTSEANPPQHTPEIPMIHSNRNTGVQKASERTSGWSFDRTGDFTGDALTSYCDVTTKARTSSPHYLSSRKLLPLTPKLLGSTRAGFPSSFTSIALASHHSCGGSPLRIAMAKALGSG